METSVMQILFTEAENNQSLSMAINIHSTMQSYRATLGAHLGEKQGIN